ncbi:MAG: hypothetical protein K2H09_02340, partial [Treponemataceae bacterium]|nr:hypothetical protein [Treponemataceae bacterium]
MKGRAVLSLVLSAAVLTAGGAQTASAGLFAAGEIRSADEGIAAREFRRGVQAYYRGAYNEAILQFERALSYMPDDNLILNWMGKAYFHSGMEGTALKEWQRVLENGYGGLLLENKMEAVRERRVLPEPSGNEVRYTDAGSFPGVFNGNLIFSGPVSVLPNNDGSVWILAYGSNELLLMNANGTVIRRVTGPLNGFDRPLDVIRLSDGSLLVSESAGDRLALLDKKGGFLSYIGGKGRGVGGLVGPQYLAQDGRKNIYVSDYGNCRVDVFDKDGNGLFFFGGKDDGFEGLKGPTGIAVIGGSVFVADDVKGCIYEFDLAGNYRRMLVEERTFRRPESMKVWNGYLVVCDSNKVFSVDSDSGAVYENASTGNAPSRLTSAVPDVNGNILVSDLQANEVYVMSRMQELVGGLFVQIERVNADAFPEVSVEVSVSGRQGNPIVGLHENNFYFTEGGRPVADVKFLGAASVNEVADIAVVIDRSAGTARYSQQGDSVVRELAAAMNGAGTL